MSADEAVLTSSIRFFRPAFAAFVSSELPVRRRSSALRALASASYASIPFAARRADAAISCDALAALPSIEIRKVASPSYGPLTYHLHRVGEHRAAGDRVELLLARHLPAAAEHLEEAGCGDALVLQSAEDEVFYFFCCSSRMTRISRVDWTTIALASMWCSAMCFRITSGGGSSVIAAA